MNNEESEVTPMSPDCSSIWCSANPCGLGGIHVVEYCYQEPLGGGPLTHCGCDHF